MRARIGSVVVGLIAAQMSVALLTTVPVSAAPAPTCAMTSTVRQGSESKDVTCLETRLVALGYSVVGPDTSFGASTAKAVRAYQASNRLVVDGVVGPMTRASLGLTVSGTANTSNSTSTSIPSLVGATPAKVTEARVIGQSVQGRNITAYRMGTPGGKVVLIIGVIHGDETKGAEITKLLRTMATPKGIDLWVIDTINPDGVAAVTRGNANAVDLNRNFDVKWSYIPKSPLHHQYSGEAPADQPETKATEAFIRSVRPKVVVWYHQDANTITINGADKAISTTYAKYVSLVPGDVPCSQLCTGTASTFANTAVAGATSFIVELPASSRVTTSMIQLHARALLAVVTL